MLIFQIHFHRIYKRMHFHQNQRYSQSTYQTRRWSHYVFPFLLLPFILLVSDTLRVDKLLILYVVLLHLTVAVNTFELADVDINLEGMAESMSSETSVPTLRKNDRLLQK